MRHALLPVAQSYGIIVHGHATRLRDVPLDDDVFFFVRHPLERFVSGFNSRLRGGRPLRDLAWTPEEEQAFAHFRTPNALAEALSAPDASEADEARFAMRHINHVRYLLTGWFTLDEIVERQARIVVLGLQPELAHDFALLKRRLALPDGVELPTDPVQAHRTPPGFETRLSAAARCNLEGWFAEDIAFYAAYAALRDSWLRAEAARPRVADVRLEYDARRRNLSTEGPRS